MKNVTGYDLVKLLCGAHGTLGVLSEVSLKVLPRTETQATLAISGLSDADAVRAMSAALGSPFEVTGAAHLPADGRTLLRLEGFAEQVSYRTARLAEVLAGFGPAETIAQDASEDLWRGIRDVARFHGAPGDVWRVSVKPSDGPGIAARAEAEDVCYDWGGGLVWLLLPEGTDLRARLGPIAGHATLVRASADTRSRLGVFQPQPAALAKISAGLREKFDPRGILNAGLMDTITEPAT